MPKHPIRDGVRAGINEGSAECFAAVLGTVRAGWRRLCWLAERTVALLRWALGATDLPPG